MTCACEPQNWGLGDQLGPLASQPQATGRLSAGASVVDRQPPVSDPTPHRVCHGQLVSGAGNILLFSKAGRLETQEILLICTELRFSSQWLEK